ncbi:MAG: hypothetical protein LC723_13405 [Actinobacteria bacterium]|nr:hypothetical protein [Actinomycetota bacterium]
MESTSVVPSQLPGAYVYFGCDPELFVQDGEGNIIGAERIMGAKKSIAGGYAVLDGVQLELHPPPNPCRANLGNTIQNIFRDLQKHLSQPEFREKKYSICFRPFIEVSRKEHQALSPESRVLGCTPSLNVYRGDTGPKVNPFTYRKRSAGGHIHMGQLPFLPQMKKDPEIAARFVRVLDILVGNTSVLIDRDPNAALRRRNYGRAGEYRLPPHGLEYRVLSNFWMHSYQLMSLVMGLCRLSASVISARYPVWYQPGAWDAESALLALVKREDIVRAIDRNDYDLARSNYEKVKPFIQAHVTSFESGLHGSYLTNFDIFLDRVRDHGLSYWFPQDPMTHWCNKPEGHNTGWETFISRLPETEVQLHPPTA